jgi:hypothetical protein
MTKPDTRPRTLLDGRELGDDSLPLWARTSLHRNLPGDDQRRASHADARARCPHKIVTYRQVGTLPRNRGPHLLRIEGPLADARKVYISHECIGGWVQ